MLEALQSLVGDVYSWMQRSPFCSKSNEVYRKRHAQIQYYAVSKQAVIVMLCYFPDSICQGHAEECWQMYCVLCSSSCSREEDWSRPMEGSNGRRFFELTNPCFQKCRRLFHFWWVQPTRLWHIFPWFKRSWPFGCLVIIYFSHRRKPSPDF